MIFFLFILILTSKVALTESPDSNIDDVRIETDEEDMFLENPEIDTSRRLKRNSDAILKKYIDNLKNVLNDF